MILLAMSCAHRSIELLNRAAEAIHGPGSVSGMARNIEQAAWPQNFIYELQHAQEEGRRKRNRQ
jgi:hypothetical protein